MTGRAFPPDRRDEALEPFKRLDAARNPNKGGGVGLGLSIAADIARSHGGALRLGESAGLGGLRAELQRRALTVDLRRKSGRAALAPPGARH